LIDPAGTLPPPCSPKLSGVPLRRARLVARVLGQRARM